MKKVNAFEQVLDVSAKTSRNPNNISLKSIKNRQHVLNGTMTFVKFWKFGALFYSEKYNVLPTF